MSSYNRRSERWKPGNVCYFKHEDEGHSTKMADRLRATLAG
jgi:hypothetical protein